MALEIKSPPVLEGKAAQEFYKRWAEVKDDTSKEEAQASLLKSKAFFAKYYNPYRKRKLIGNRFPKY
jgi:hypothetical protein